MNHSRRSSLLFTRQTLLILLLAGMLGAVALVGGLGLGVGNGLAVVASLAALLSCLVVGELIRRRGQVNLKAFLAGFTVIALLLGAFGQRLVESRRQHAAAGVILQLGGRVAYDFRHDDSSSWMQTRGGLILPIWLRHLFGDELFGHLIDVELYQSPCSDADLARARAALAHLTRMNLAESRVTGSGLEVLKDSSELRTIVLDGKQATQIGLSHLGEVDSLEEVILIGPAVTDDTLRHLAPLTQLQHLYLWNTGITGDGLCHLQSLDGLQSLQVSNANVDDRGMSHLAKLPSLRRIYLSQTKVSDAGIAQLKELQSLRRLGIHRCPGVTPEGLQAVREAMRHVKFDW